MHNLWWLAAGAGGYGARYVTHRFRLMRRPPVADPDDDLLRLQSLHGYNAHSLVSLAPGALAWQMDGIDGAVIYNRFGHVWLAAGDPLVRTEDQAMLVKGFMAAARRHRCVAAFVPATERFAREAAALGMTAIKIGAAPCFDLQSWQPRGNSAKKLRAGINQASRGGVKIETIESLTDQLRREVADLCRLWLKSRRAATTFGWLLALDPLVQAERKRFFAARDAEGRLVGFLSASPIPARHGWYLEDVLRHPEAPQGTADLLVYEALRQLKAEGAAMATLGTAPLAKDGADDISTNDHPVIERALGTAAKRFGAFYNFEGLRRFKAKFVPCWWESEYVLIQHGVMVPTRVAHALLKAMVPGGLTQLLTRQAVRSLKHNSNRLATGSH